MILKKGNDGCQQSWFVRPVPQFVCPDSGQVEEPLGAAFVGQHRRERGESEGIRVVWCLKHHILQTQIDG